MSKSYEVTGETTEWEDILIKKGIKTKEEVLIEKGLNPADFQEKVQEEVRGEDELERLFAKLENAEDLDELEDDKDFNETNILNEYREQRLRQLQEERVRNRYGDVNEITKDEWLTQVTEASKNCWVVVHLYQDSVIECRLVEEALQQLAAKFKYVKFLKIRSTQAVENWPESKLPALFLYHQGNLAVQLVTLKEVYGKSMKPIDLEWWFVTKGVVTTSELEEDPRIESEMHSAGSGSRKKISAAANFAQERNIHDDDDD